MTFPPSKDVPLTVRYSSAVEPTVLLKTALPLTARYCCPATVPFSILPNVAIEPVNVASAVKVAAPV